MKKYSDDFKRKALLNLEKINRGESIKVKGSRKKIKTVRALCLALNISSQTIYKWRGQIEAKKSFLDLHGKELKDVEDIIEIEDTEEIEDIEDVVSSEKTPDLAIEKLAIPSKDVVPKEIQSKGIKKSIYGLRFYGWYAKNLGIKNYSKMSLKALKKAIGLILIGESK